MQKTLSHAIKNANQEELVQVYLSIEPQVLPLLEQRKKEQALDDLKNNRTETGSSAQEIMQKCLQK